MRWRCGCRRVKARDGISRLRGCTPYPRSFPRKREPRAALSAFVALGPRLRGDERRRGIPRKRDSLMLCRPGGMSGARAAPGGSFPSAITRGMERRVALCYLHATAGLACTTIAGATIAATNLAAWGVASFGERTLAPRRSIGGICGEGQASTSTSGPCFRNRRCAGCGSASSSRGGRSTARTESGAARVPCVRGTARGAASRPKPRGLGHRRGLAGRI